MFEEVTIAIYEPAYSSSVISENHNMHTKLQVNCVCDCYLTWQTARGHAKIGWRTYCFTNHLPPIPIIDSNASQTVQTYHTQINSNTSQIIRIPSRSYLKIFRQIVVVRTLISNKSWSLKVQEPPSRYVFIIPVMHIISVRLEVSGTTILYREFKLLSCGLVCPVSSLLTSV